MYDSIRDSSNARVTNGALAQGKSARLRTVRSEVQILHVPSAGVRKPGKAAVLRMRCVRVRLPPPASTSCLPARKRARVASQPWGRRRPSDRLPPPASTIHNRQFIIHNPRSTRGISAAEEHSVSNRKVGGSSPSCPKSRGTQIGRAAHLKPGCLRVRLSPSALRKHNTKGH